MMRSAPPPPAPGEKTDPPRRRGSGATVMPMAEPVPGDDWTAAAVAASTENGGAIVSGCESDSHPRASDDATAVVPDLTHTQQANPVAWSLDDETKAADGSDWRPLPLPLRILLACVCIGAMVLAVFVVERMLRQRTVGQQHSIPVTSKEEETQQHSLLNGVYRVDYHWKLTTVRDNHRQGGGTMHWDHENADSSKWWAFTSRCTDMACIATGTEVDGQDHHKAATPEPTVFMQLVNGIWQVITPNRVQSQATSTQDGSLVCTAWQSIRWTFEPLPDGTLHGDRTQSTETQDCGDQGDTAVTPITATRVADIPPRLVHVPPTPTAAPEPPALAAPVVSSVPSVARADPDKRFLAMMTDAGLTITDARQAISGAHEVCPYLAAGYTQADAVHKTMQNNPSLPEPAATAFVRAAIQIYCPSVG